MSKETRFNLVFLVALLLLCLPGVVLLISKQLKPGARRLADPPHVRRTEAYNNPLPASSASIRVAPPITQQWVEKLAFDRLGHPPLRHEAAGGRSEPIMSQGRRFELLGIEEQGEQTRIVLLAWIAELGRGEVSQLEAETQALGGLESVEVERLEVRPDVVRELKDLGFVLPPARVGLVWLRFAPVPKPDADSRLRIVWRTGSSQAEDVLDLRSVLPAARGGDKEVKPGQQSQQGEDQ